MNEKTEQLTTRARQTLYYAEYNAKLLGHIDTMPCHIMLAFLQDPAGLAYRIVTELGVGTDEVLDQIEATYPRQPQSNEQFGITEATKQLLKGAADEARLLGHYIGTEHLLIGVAGSPDLAMQAVFDAKGLTYNDVREYVHKVLRTSMHGQKSILGDAPNTIGGMYQMASWLLILAGLDPLPPPTASLPNPIRQAEKQAKLRQRFEADVRGMTALLSNFPDHPSTSNVYRKRSLAHMWLGRYNDSAADLTNAIESKPSDIENYLVRMMIYELQGELDLAVQDCNAILNLAPGNKSAYNSRASIYTQQHQFEKAKADLETSYQITLDPAEREFGRGELAFHQGDFATSAKYFRGLITLMPAKHTFNIGIIYRYLGKSLGALNDVNGAVVAFKKALNVWSLPPLKRPQEWLIEMYTYVEQYRPQR